MNFEVPLDALLRSGVRFVIVGGVAMNLQGSAQNTNDLDIVYARDIQNIRKLVAALSPFDPKLRGTREPVPFRFDELAMRNGMNFTLSTSLGAIDLFGEIAGVGGFEAVSKMSEKIRLRNKSVRVLSLAGLIRAKRAAGRRRDLMVIPELEALEELARKTELPKVD